MVVTCQMTVILLFFGQWGVLWIRIGAKGRIGDVVTIVILEIKITVFACLLRDKGCDAFPDA